MTEPVELSERSIQNLASAVTTAIGGGRPFGGGGRSDSTAGRGFAEDAQRIANGAHNLVSSVGLLTQGTYGLTQAAGDVGKVAGMFGPVGENLSKFGEGVLGIAVDTNKYMMDASKSGFGFSQNLGLFASSVLGAQISLPRFKQLIDESGKSLAGLEITASKSAIGYLSMLQEINENKDVAKARLTGLDDFDKTLQLSASMSRNLNMKDEASRKTVIDSAIQMAYEMDNIARLTGKSRQEQQRQMEQQMQKAEMEVMTMALSKEEQAALKENMTYMGKYGEDYRDFLTEITVGEGDVLSRKGTQQAAAIDAVAPGVTALMTELVKTNGDDPTSKQRRQDLRDEIDLRMQNAAADKAHLKEIAKLRATDGNETTKMMGDMIAGSKNELLVQQRINETRKEGETLADARKRVEDEFARQRLTAGTKAADPAALASQAMIGADNFFKQVSSGWGKTFDGLNTSTGKFIGTIENLDQYFKMRQQRNTGLTVDNAGNVIKDAIGYTGQAVSPEAVSERNKGRAKAVQGKALGDDFVPAGWEGWVGEDGPEWLKIGGQSNIKSNNVSMGMLENMANKLPVMVTGLQNDLKKQMAEAKSSMPSTDSLQQMISTLTAKMNTAPTESTAPASPFSPRTTDAESALQKGIDQVNTKLTQLIRAVEDGTSKNVKAVKSTGNMLT